MIKYIVFDFDGTIANSMVLFVKIGNLLAEKYNKKPLTEEDFRILKKLPIRERCKRVGISMYQIPKLTIEIIGHYRKYVGTIQEVTGMNKVIGQLKELGYELIIISSNSVSNIEHYLNNHQVKGITQIYSSKGLFGKDRTIKEFRKQHNVRADEMIYIGDETRDIEACQKAKVPIIAVTWGFDSVELLRDSKPNYLADQPEQLLELIPSL